MMRTSVTMLESNYFKIIDDVNEAQEQAPVVEKTFARKAVGVPDNDNDDMDENEDENEGGGDKDCIILYNRRTNHKKDDAYEKHLQNVRNYYKKHKKKVQEIRKNGEMPTLIMKVAEK